MRRILIALSAGLLLITLSACGGDSPSKAKTDSSDSDSSDSKSSSKSTKSSSSKSSSSKGGSIDALCAQIDKTASVFSDLGNSVPSDKEIDAIVKALKALQAAAPDEIADDMKTFVDIEVEAATAVKAAANDSDAQSSAADKVISRAGDAFITAATNVDKFATDNCGVGITGEPASTSFSYSFTDSFTDSFSS